MGITAPGEKKHWTYYNRPFGLPLWLSRRAGESSVGSRPRHAQPDPGQGYQPVCSLGAIRPEEELRQIDELAPRGVATGERYPDMRTVNCGAAHLSRIMLRTASPLLDDLVVEANFLVQASNPLQSG
jgi:hypothetical protein